MLSANGVNFQIGAPKVTREDVLAALDMCDAMGERAFLARFGYGPSKLYHLRHKGRSYPSKAVLGVAAGLSARDFFAGAAHTVRRLRELGFEVREGERVVTDQALLDTAREVSAELGVEVETFRLPEALPADPTIYFASGSNRPPEIQGCARVGQDVGVAAPEVTPVCEEALGRLAGTDVQVFVDSGAFSEVSFKVPGREGQPVVVAEITPERWDRVLSLYERLAAVLGDQLHVVAPDRVGDQETTLALLTRYRDRLAGIARAGARVLAPIQKGALTQAAFAAKVHAILFPLPWVPAVPCKKAATTPEDLRAFLASWRPEHVHLLGLGPWSEGGADYFEVLAEAGVSYQCDSVMIRSQVGRNKDGSARKPYTLAQDISRVVVGRLKVQLDPRELGLVLLYGLAAPTAALAAGVLL